MWSKRVAALLLAAVMFVAPLNDGVSVVRAAELDDAVDVIEQETSGDSNEPSVESATESTDDSTESDETTDLSDAEATTDLVEETVEDEELLGKIPFGINMHANGGQFEDGSYLKVNYLSQAHVISELIPTRDGYYFVGWFLDSEMQESCVGESIYTLKYEKEKDSESESNAINRLYNGKTLYAGWAKEQPASYNVTLVFGTGNTNNPDPLKDTGYILDKKTGEKVRSITVAVTVGEKIPYYEALNDDLRYKGSHYVRKSDETYGSVLTQEGFYDYYTEDGEVFNISSTAPQSDITLYKKYYHANYVVTIHANDDTAYFTKTLKDADAISADGKTYYWTHDIEAIARENEGGYPQGSDFLSVVENTDDSIDVVSYTANYPSDASDRTYKRGYGVHVTEDFDLYLNWGPKTQTSTSTYLRFDVSDYGEFISQKDGTSISVYEIKIEPNTWKDYSYDAPAVTRVPHNLFLNDPHGSILGWTLTKGSTHVDYDNLTRRFSGIEDITLYPVIKNNSYFVVRYHGNGGNFGFKYHDYEYAIKDGILYTPVSKSGANYASLSSEDSLDRITISRDGYTFDGWYLDENFTQPLITRRGGVIKELKYTKDYDLYAKWTKNHTVTFAYDDKTTTIDISDNSSFAQENKSLPKDPTSDNAVQEFAGWYIDPEFTTPITKAEILNLNIDEDKTFYGKYTDTVTVTFNANGGFIKSSNDATVSVKVAKGTNIGSLCPDVDITGNKMFDAWSTDQAGQEKIDSIYNYKATENITLYAQYADCYSITFHVNNKVAKFNGTEDIIKVKVQKGKAFRYEGKLFDAPNLVRREVGILPVMRLDGRNGFSIVYNDKADGTGKQYIFTDIYHVVRTNVDGKWIDSAMPETGFVPNSNIDLYVQWGDPIDLNFYDYSNHRWHYDFEEGDSYWIYQDSEGVECTNFVVAKGTLLEDLVIPEDVLKDDMISWNSSRVTGFYTDKACKNVAIQNAALTGDTKIYLKWTDYKSTNALYFHAGAGYFESDTPTVYVVERDNASKHTITCQIPKIRKKGMAFGGWYTDEACTKPYNSSNVQYVNGQCIITVASNVSNLYADYALAKTVKLDANGGYFGIDANTTTATIQAKELIAGKGVYLTEYNQLLQRADNKIFAGWYKDAELTERAVTDSYSYANEFYVPAEDDEILYAKWIDFVPKDITLDCDKNVAIVVGQSLKLNATLLPNEDGEVCKWVVDSSTGAIKLGADGTITGVAAGTAVIHAEATGVTSEQVAVKVTTAKTAIALPSTVLYMTLNESVDLEAVTYPVANASKVKWTTGNKKIVSVTSVDGKATLTAGATTGQTVITAAVGSVKTKLTVYVTDAIKLNKEKLILTGKEGVTEYITAQLAGSENSNKKINWTVDDSSVVSISTNTAYSKTVAITPATNLTETKQTTITATIDGTDYSASAVVTVNPIQTVAAPTADRADGTVNKGTLVQFATRTYGADIYYTLDGSTPTVESTLYTNPIKVNDSVVIKAVAIKNDCNDSAVSTFTYTVDHNNWGDISDNAIKGLFENDSTNVPEGMWYIIGNTNAYYTTGSVTSYVEIFTTKAITFNEKIQVYHGTTKLVVNRDYKISYRDNKVANTADAAKKAPTVILTGARNYNSKAEFKFTIAKANLDDATVTTESILPVKIGTRVKLGGTKPAYSYNGVALKNGKDYVLKYYKDTVSDENLIADPSKETLNEPGVTYVIVAGAKTGSNYTGAVSDAKYVYVKTVISKAVLAGELKAVNAKGKAIAISYDDENAVDVVTLFDNSDGKIPQGFVKYKNKVLTYGDDYTVETVPGDDYKSAGTHKFVIVGSDELYTGRKTCTFAIEGKKLKDVKIAGLATTVQYTATDITIEDLFNAKDKNLDEGWTGVTLYTAKSVNKKVIKTPLTKDVDYTVSIANTGILGKFTLTFTGINQYEGSVSKKITVQAYNIATNPAGRINITTVNTTYAKAGAKPDVQVTFDGKLLKEGVDYTVSYKNNQKIVSDADELAKLAASKRPTVVVKGKGNFTGTNDKTYFCITKAPISNAKITLSDVKYDVKKSGKSGYFMTATPTLTDNGTKLAAGKNKDVEKIKNSDYRYFYVYDTVLKDGTNKYAGDEVVAKDQVPAGTTIRVEVKVVCSEKSHYVSVPEGTVLTGYFRIIDNGKDISKYTAKIKDLKKVAYNDSNAIIPLKAEDIEVSYKTTVNKKTVTVVLEPSDYEITSITNNKLIGTAKVTLKGNGQYGGTKTITFKINAKGLNN